MRLSVKIFFKDLLAVLIFGSLGAYFSYLLYTDINQSLNAQDVQEIGRVLELNNTPKRKFDGRTLWAALDKDAPIYANDTIKTFENDQLSILLEDGTEITLEPNSMIRLEGDKINFNGGSISAINRSGTSEVNIVTADGSVLTLDKGSVDVSQKDGEEVELTVTQGEAKLTSTDGQSRSLDTRESLSVNQRGEVQSAVQYSISITSPLSQQYFSSYDSPQEIPFLWELPQGQSDSRLIISNYADLRDPVVDQIYSQNSARIELNPGRYFFQLRSDSGQSLLSRFVVIQENIPTPLQPAEGEEILYRASLPRVAFQWEPSRYADKYLVEVSEDEQFTRIVKRMETQDNYAFDQDLSAGNYWWRVSPHLPVNEGLWMDYSQGQSFSVAQDLSLAETLLLSPSDEALMSRVQSAEGVRFIWKSDRDAAEYRFRLSRNSDMTNLLENIDLTENYYYIQLPETGIYYWNVEGRTFDNLALPSSEIYRFEVRDVKESISYILPEPDAAIEIEAFEPLRFQWDSLEERFYHFKLWFRQSGGLEEQLIGDNFTRNKSIMVVLPGDGEYRWQVAAVDETYNVIDQGKDQYFRISSPFIGPRILSPAPESRFSLIGQPELSLEWESLDKADLYHASLYRSDSEEALRTRRNLSETTWKIEDFTGIREGEYRLEVYAVRLSPPAGFTAQSTLTKRTFYLDEVSVFDPPRLSYPPNGSRISSLDLLREDLMLRWEADSQLNQFTLNLYGSEAQEIPAAQYKTDRRQISLQDLAPGVYYWEIVAQDRRGYKAPVSPRSRFEISPMPSLERPRIIAPIKNSEVDMTYRDSLEFEWGPVENAEYYSLSLYNNEGLLVFQKSNLRNTRYVLTDLTVLDIGEFFVEIKAEQYIDDLNLQISSLPVRSGFRISLNQEYKIPEVRSSDVQYTD